MLQLPSLYLYLSSHVSRHLEETVALRAEGRVIHSCLGEGLCFPLPSSWARLKIHGEWCWNFPLPKISGWWGKGDNSWLLPACHWPLQSPLNKNTRALSCNFIIPWMILVILSWKNSLHPSQSDLLVCVITPPASWVELFHSFSLAASMLSVLTFVWGSHKLSYNKNNHQTLLLSIRFCHF